MDDIAFFSDDLPYRLPIWQSIILSERKFSIYTNRTDLNSIPNSGGHMINYNKKKDKFEPYKKDSFFNISFKPDNCLLPYRIKCDQSNENIFKKTDCLVIDDNNKMIINTNSYNHYLKQSLIFKSYHENIEDYDNWDNSFELFLLTKHGNIEKLNKFVNIVNENFNHVRQEKMITIFKLKNDKQNLIIDKSCKYLVKNSNDKYFDSDQNLTIPNILIGSYNSKNETKINEIDFDVNKKIWEKKLFLHEPVQLNYSKFHPKLIFYLSDSQLNLYDTRMKKGLNKIFEKETSNCLLSFETLKLFSSLSLNPNYFCLSTNYNCFIGDHRYPKVPLLIWNHTLENKTDVSFLKEIEFNNQNIVFIGNKQEISFVSLSKTNLNNLQHPKMEHIPYHLSNLNDLIQYSSTTDIKLKNYLKESKIVGFDFLIRDDNFKIFIMNQFGDIFHQKFSKSKPFNEDENPFLKINLNSRKEIDSKLKLIKKKLCEVREEFLRKNGIFVKKEVKDRTFWLNFIENLNLSEEDKIPQDIKEQKDCLNTESLIKIIDDSTENDKSDLKTKLLDIFKNDSKDFDTNDLLELKWSDFSYKLLDAWKIKTLNFVEFNKQLSSQNIDLNKYI